MKRKIKINYRRIFLIILLIIVIVYIINSLLYKMEYSGESVFPSEVYGIQVHTKLVESGNIARTEKKRKIKYIVVHETANTSNGATAKSHAEYLSKNNKTTTAWHYTVDDKEIYHHIPDDEIAYHAATEKGNLYGIGIELCVNKDGSFERTFDNATKLVAYLLNEYDLTTKSIKTHNEFSGKDCPHNILKEDRMNEFIKKVEGYMKENEVK